jgi:hypothetical protein
MLTILSCDCGHRFEVTDPSGSDVPCPKCGLLLQVPGTPPVTLRTAQYLNREVPRGPDDPDSPVREVTCPDCKGTGACVACRGRGVMVTQGWLRTVGHVTLFLLFGIWAVLLRSIFENPAVGSDKYGRDGCLKCNGRGHCHLCRGAGKVLIRAT